MNFLNRLQHTRWIPLLFLVFLCATPLLALGAKPLGETETTWPGVVYEVTEIQRVKGNYLLVTVRLSVGASAENPTFIGVPPAGGWKKRADLTPEELAGGKYDPSPLSLTNATLVDQITKTAYKALPTLPAAPFVGPNTVMTTLRPGGWLQLAVLFPAPPPPPDDGSGKAPAQKVTLQFPNAKLPVQDLTLPP